MKVRPVMINRAPVWHRYGFMSAWPVLVSGETLQISPIVTPGFGADFDGDAMNYHVPVSDDAVKEATEKMMPSKNLFSVEKFDVHYLPRQEYLHGLYLTTRGAKPNKLPRTFVTTKDAIQCISSW
jgi:DNA-directed RNA polymerase beta' subunit